jgi:hypothetical protein
LSQFNWILHSFVTARARNYLRGVTDEVPLRNHMQQQNSAVFRRKGGRCKKEREKIKEEFYKSNERSLISRRPLGS